MVLLIGGASHTGKTCLAQRLLEEHGYPYLSIDHLKMGLIRSGRTDLTPYSDDEALTGELWPILREIIKTVVENGQNLILEGCYIPFDWKKDFSDRYLKNIRYIWLAMSEEYIIEHFDAIRGYANAVERRLEDDCTCEELRRDNRAVLEGCRAHGLRCWLIDGAYRLPEIGLFQD